MPAKKQYKKKYPQKASQSKKIYALQKQVKSIQINDKPESKFKMFNYSLIPNTVSSGIPYSGANQSFSVFNNIAPGTDQQSRVGAKIKPKTLKLRIYIPATLSTCLMQIFIFKVKDAKYDQNNSNLQKYWNDVTTFNGADPADPVRYQHLIPLKRMLIQPSATAYERIIQPKPFHLKGDVTYENFTQLATNGNVANQSTNNVLQGEVFVYASISGGCPGNVNQVGNKYTIIVNSVLSFTDC